MARGTTLQPHSSGRWGHTACQLYGHGTPAAKTKTKSIHTKQREKNPLFGYAAEAFALFGILFQHFNATAASKHTVHSGTKWC